MPWLITSKQKQRQFLLAKVWLSFHALYTCLICPLDLFLFWKIKLQLLGHSFQGVPEIQEQSLTVLNVIPESSISASSSGRNAGHIV